MNLSETILWKSVQEELPDDELTVLVFMPGSDDGVALAFHVGNLWLSDSVNELHQVTHWADMLTGPFEDIVKQLLTTIK